MLKTISGLRAIAVASLIGFAFPSSHVYASLAGDLVTCSGNLFVCNTASATVVDSVGFGAEFTFPVFPDFPRIGIDVDASAVTLRSMVANTVSFGGFDLLTLGDLDSSLGDIVGIDVPISHVTLIRSP